MQQLLIVESSATLRYGLKKAISLPEIELIDAADCHQALARLSYLSGSLKQPRGIILGWPPQASTYLHEFVAYLCQPPHDGLPLLVMAEDMETLGSINLGERKNTKIQLWSELEKINSNLKAVLSPSVERAVRNQSKGGDEIKILLVDDSKTIRAQFGALLRKQGYAVDISESPDQAYAMAQIHHYDIAIVDYYMPGQNGAELCTKLKRDPGTQHMDLAVLTGSYNDSLVTDVLDSGAVECMFKSESSKLFIARVNAMVRRCKQNREMERERTQLDNILSSVGDGVYGVDLDGQLTFINPAALRILGYEADTLVLGRTAHEVFHHSDLVSKPVNPSHCFLHQAYKLGDQLENWETSFWSAKGVSVPVECSLMPIYTDNSHTGSVVAFRDISERLLFEEELKWQINHDHLTQLLNRQYLEQALESEIKRLTRSGDSSAVLFIDLDRFKQINDLAGHAAGDQLLIEISSKLKERVRESDVLARVSGDEFAVILHNINMGQAESLAESFREILDLTTFTYADNTFDITGSIGVAIMDSKSLSSERVLANADAACHMAKNKGRNRIHIFDEAIDKSSFDEKEKGWIERLSEALENDRFSLTFQPIYKLSEALAVQHQTNATFDDNRNNLIPTKGNCNFFEILLRLSDDQNEPILPRAFLPSAERFGLVWSIDCWVLENVAEILRVRHVQGIREKFAINISDQTLLKDEFPQFLIDLIKNHSIDPNSLLLEIRENRVVSNFHKMQCAFDELAKLGIRVVIDEFGMGHSSFSHLQHLKVNIVKMNGSFVQGMPHDPIDKTMVETINDVAHILNRKTIAQHVESSSAFHLLEKIGVDYVQGYFLSEPLKTLP